MSEFMSGPRPEDSGRVHDPDEAHAMALAGDRNESNILAFKNITEAHMRVPDARESPLRAQTGVIDSMPYSSTDPSVRIVKAIEGGYGLSHTADSAIGEAILERREADRVEDAAAVRYRKLKNL